MHKKTEAKHVRKLSSRLIIAGALLCALFIVLCTSSYAIFTSSLRAQRTIAAYDTQGAKFSSNYLLKGYSRDNVRTVFTTNASVSAVAVTTICNYQQGRQTLPCPDNVSYTLTARLVKYDESEALKYIPVDAAYISGESLTAYTVSITDDVNSCVLGNTTLSHTFSGSLTGRTADSDAYTITFSANFSANKPNLYLELEAVPSVASLPTIRAIFKPDLRAAGATDYWTGYFTDDTSSQPSAYDGYNYIISGTGSGTATVSWDSTKVTLSDISRDTLLSVPGASEGVNSITLPVDSDLQSRYELQFYKTNITSQTWPQMSSQVVTFNFS